MPERRNSSTGTPWETRFGYSRVVVAGGMAFVSGTVAADHTGRIHAPGDASGAASRRSQCRRFREKPATKGRQDGQSPVYPQPAQVSSPLLDSQQRDATMQFLGAGASQSAA